MSIHKSLKTGAGIGGTRNVLTRYERILQMESQGRFNEEEDSPLGLPKTRVLKVKKRAKKLWKTVRGVVNYLKVYFAHQNLLTSEFTRAGNSRRRCSPTRAWL